MLNSTHNPGNLPTLTFNPKQQTLWVELTETAFQFVGREGLATPLSDAQLDVVFVHGLGGHAVSTWSFSSSQDEFWPKWLASDLPTANIWSVQYEAPILASIGDGPGASIFDVATTLLDFAIAKGIGKRPVVFIAHSLGGLVVKQMLRSCSDSENREWRGFLSATTGIVFLATPHVGAKLAASITAALSAVSSNKIKGLAYGQDSLIDLSNWFKSWANERGLAVLAYYESKKTNGVMVVDKVTANPNVSTCSLVAVEADHISICKPSTRASHVYTAVSHFLSERLSPAASYIAALPFNSPPQPVVYTREGLMQLPAANQSIKVAPASATEGVTESPLSSEVANDYELYTTEAAGSRRTLDQKLRDGDRSHEIARATALKERFAKTLHRNIAQPSSLTRYVRLLSDVATRFNRVAYPAIVNGASNEDVNKIIQTEVIDGVAGHLPADDADITSTTIESALFYLTGNCHVRWDDSEN